MHLHEDDLQLYIFDRLGATRESEVKLHLGECAACRARFAEALHFVGQLSELQRRQHTSGAERRRHTRIPANAPASVRILNPLSTARLEAMVLDTSREGLRLRIPESIPRGAIIQVLLADAIVLAEVRYCEPAGPEFRVGVRIQDSFPVHYEAGVSRRKDLRHPIRLWGRLRVEGLPEVFTVLVLEVSRAGLRVRCPSAVAEGTRVNVLCRKAAAFGQVRYARKIAPDQFHLGIEVDDALPRDEAAGSEIDLTVLFGLN
jgi:hypothetical protein